jgi:hypothetical protein
MKIYEGVLLKQYKLVGDFPFQKMIFYGPGLFSVLLF